VANKYVEYHREIFKYDKSNVKFLKGNIEKLRDLHIQEESIDIIV